MRSPVWRNQTWWVYLCTGIALLLFLAAVEVFILAQWHQVLESHERRSALKEEVLRLRQLASDIDNGFRGYVLMRQRIFLAPMLSAEETLPLSLERLARMAETPPSLHGRVQVLKRRLEELAATKRRLVAKVDRGEYDEVLTYMRNGDGVALAKILAAAFDDLEDKIERQFPSLERSHLEVSNKTVWQLVAVRAGVVVLGVLIVQSLLAAFPLARRHGT
jgi:CHASE3 domain sensor protein